MINNYTTEQRKIIENYLLKNSDKFVNAIEILEYMKNNNQIVGLTTIYRFLNLLEKNNDVRIENRNHTKYYQYVTKENYSQLFLKCKKCGNSMNLDCEEFNHVKKHISNKHRFNLDYSTIIYGICHACSERIKGIE